MSGFSGGRAARCGCGPNNREPLLLGRRGPRQYAMGLREMSGELREEKPKVERAIAALESWENLRGRQEVVARNSIGKK